MKRREFCAVGLTVAVDRPGLGLLAVRFDAEPPTHLARSRRFPPPWSVEEQAAHFVVRGLRKSFEKGLI